MATTEEQNRRIIVRKSVDKWRHTEAGLLTEMSELLPYSREVKATLNKPSILRLASVYIQLKQLEEGMAVQEIWDGTETFVDSFGGFLLTVHDTGLILHMSDQVYNMLGYYSHDLIGQNIMDYLHPEDRQVFLRKTAPLAACGQAGQSMKVDFMARIKYKTMAREKKTKNTGYLGLQIRGLLKRVGSGVNSCWLLVGACYPPFVVLSMEMKTYEASFVIKFDKNREPMDIPDQLSELEDYLGFGLDYIFNCSILVTKDVVPFIAESKRMSMERGCMDFRTKSVTRNGHLYQVRSRSTLLYGKNGEQTSSVTHVFITSKEKFNGTINWPKKKKVPTATLR